MKVKTPTATLIAVQIEGSRYKWVEGFKIIDPEGAELQPYMRKRAARRFCKAQGWVVKVPK